MKSLPNNHIEVNGIPISNKLFRTGIWNVAKPIHVIKKHLPIQNKANNEKSCSTLTPDKDSQSGGH